LLRALPLPVKILSTRVDTHHPTWYSNHMTSTKEHTMTDRKVSEGAPAHMPKTALQARDDEFAAMLDDDDMAEMFARALAEPAPA